MSESKQKSTNIGAGPGKVKGEGTVTPKAEALAPVEGADVGEHELQAAYEAGNLASKRGTRSRPPLGYSDAEVKAWYRGYKAHANPQNGGPVDGITGGYRGDY